MASAANSISRLYFSDLINERILFSYVLVVKGKNFTSWSDWFLLKQYLDYLLVYSFWGSFIVRKLQFLLEAISSS